jgi:hypothetical protein
MARSRQRVRLEDGLKLNINKLIGRGGIHPGSKTRAIASCPQAYGGQSLSGVLTADLSYPVRGWMRLELGSEDHWLELVTEPRHFGGRQWYFLCPQTGRRASVLWKPPGARSFASRQHWGRQVAYGSQFKPAYDRANARAQKIYNRLGGSSLDAAIPDKPKGMHWRTYESKLARAEAYDMQYGLALAGFIMRLKR